jgi:uncharacterized protein
MLIFFITLLSEFLGTLVTFGSSSFFVPIATILYGTSATLALVSLLHVTSNMLKIFVFSKGLSWKIVIYFGIPAILFTGAGAVLSKYLPEQYSKLILGIVILLGVVLEIFASRLKVIMNQKMFFVGGTLSGFMTGLVGTGGAIRGIFLLMLNVDKDVMIASSSFVDFWEDLLRLGIYWKNGNFTPEIWAQWPYLFAGSVIAIILAKFAIDKISKESLRKIVIVALVTLSIYYILSFFITTCLQSFHYDL